MTQNATEAEIQQLQREIAEHLDMDKQQAACVFDVMRKNNGLSFSEAASLAVQRHPSIFGNRSSEEFDTRPRLAPQPKPRRSEHAARMKYAHDLVKAGHRHAAEEVTLGVIAAAAAKALGWGEMKRQPIPDSYYTAG
jgi:uncharacterized protein HemY